MQPSVHRTLQAHQAFLVTASILFLDDFLFRSQYHAKPFGACYLYWRPGTNQYTTVDNHTHQVLNRMKTINTPLQNSGQLSPSEATPLYNNALQMDIEPFLKQWHSPLYDTVKTKTAIPKQKINFRYVKHYKLRRHSVTIHADTLANLALLNAGMAHVEVPKPFENPTAFWLYELDKKLFLFKDKTLLLSVPVAEDITVLKCYKIALCRLLYHKIKAPWLSVLSGITIELNDRATVLIGKEGSGKNTLAALLMAHNFNVVSDGYTALCAKGLMVYGNVGALTVKQGSWALLDVYFNQLDRYPVTRYGDNRPLMKYLPLKINKSHAYEAKQLVLVNYQSGAPVRLEPAGLEEVLEVLVPDSWISAHSTNAKGFMAWLQTLQFYKLTYSNTAAALRVMHQLHKSN